MSVKHPKGFSLDELDELQEESWVLENRNRVRSSISNPPPQQSGNYLYNLSAKKPSKSAAASSSKRKKLISKQQQLPPMDFDSERKIEELERLARSNRPSQPYQPLTDPPFDNTGLNDSMSTMTGTEAEFLVRQMQSDADFKPTIPDTRFLDTANDMLAKNTIEALNNKIQKLEASLSQYQQTIAQKEKELEKKDSKIKTMQTTFETLKKEKSASIDKLTSEHEMEILRLKESHAKEKAHLLTSTPLLTSSSSSNNPSDGQTTINQHKAFFDQIDLLRNELKKQQEDFNSQRTRMIADLQIKTQQKEQLHNQEISDLKVNQSHLEEKLAISKEEITLSKREITRLLSQITHLENVNVQHIQEENNLKNQLKKVQQSLQSSYRLDINQSNAMNSLNGNSTTSSPGKYLSNLPSDLETAIKLNDAKYEAKLRQMTNKLEFLKSQVETERQEHDSCKKQLEEVSLQQQQQQANHQQTLNSMEEDCQNKLFAQENQLKAMYEHRLSQLGQFQAQLQSLQQQLDDKIKEIVFLQQNESLLTEQLQRTNLQLQQSKQELMTLKQLQYQQTSVANSSSASVARDEQSNLSNNNKLSQEAIIRRLDNERNYLKNQLTSEITLKNELQKLLDTNQQTMQSMQSQWQQDVHQLQDNNQQLQQQVKQLQLDLKHTQSLQFEDDKHRNQQNEEFKQTIQQLKQAYNHEKQQRTQLTQDISQFQSQIQFLQQDKQQTQSQAKQQEQLLQEQLKHYQEMVREINEQFQRDRNHFQQQLSNELLTTSGLQQQLQDNKQLLTDNQHKSQQSLVLCKVVFRQFVLKNKLLQLQFFHRWKTSKILMHLSGQLKSSIEQLMQQQQQQFLLDKQKQTKENQDFLSEQRQRWEEEYNQQMKKNTEELEAKHQQTLEEMQLKHETQLRQTEEDCAYDLQQKHQQFEETKRLIVNEYDKTLREAHEKHEQDVLRLEKHYETLVDYKLKQQLEEISQKQLEKDQQTHQENQQKIHNLQTQLKLEAEILVDQLRSNYEKEILPSLERKHKQTIQDIQKKRDQQTVDLNREWQEKLLKYAYDESLRLKQQFAVEQAKEIAFQREQWSKEHLLVVQETSFMLQEDLRTKEIHKLTKLFKQFDEKLVAMKLENDHFTAKEVKKEYLKWKQALLNNEKNFELEMQKHDLLLEERLQQLLSKEKENMDTNFDLAIQKTKDQFAIEKEEMQLKMNQDIEDIRKQFAKESQQQLQTFQQQKLIEFEQKLQLQLHEQLELQLHPIEMKLRTTEESLSYYKNLHQEERLLFQQERKALNQQISQFEEKFTNLENLKTLSLKNQANDYEHKLDLLQLEQQETVKRMRFDWQSEQNQFKDEQEKLWIQRMNQLRQELEQKHKQTLEDLQTNLQQENQQVLQTVEKELNRLKETKESIQEEVQSLQQTIVDKEDVIYDLTTNMKKMQKDSSLKHWKHVVSFLQLKQKFQIGIQQFDSEMMAKMKHLQEEYQLKYNNLALSYAKVNHYLYLHQNILFKIQHKFISSPHSPSASSEQQFIYSQKQTIHTIEQDMEKLSIEIQLIQEQKQNLQESIDQMTTEIKEIENQILQLNKESSMTINGRINVAFARKKRRLDSEIERLLETIEIKRNEIQFIDQKLTVQQHQHDEKEQQLVDLEHQIVKVLLTLQNFSLKEMQSLFYLYDKAKDLATMQRFPWPKETLQTLETPQSLPEPTIEQIIAMVEEWKSQDQRKELK